MNHRADFSRRRFLQALLASAALGPGLAAFGADFNRLRGDRVGWARLKTSSPIWERHARSDSKLMRFFQEHTTLNIDPTWYAADVESLAEMGKYPFLFSQDIRPAPAATGQRCLIEYIRRGGFLLLDCCINPKSRGRSPRDFIDQHSQLLKEMLPDATVSEMPDRHELFRCFFSLPGGPPHTAVEYEWNAQPFYEVSVGQRMVGLISTSGLQCGWDNMNPTMGHDVLCMQTLVNIYIYAMTQAT
jgi:hypothetical protein